jgi:hypothetical protein
MKRHNAEKILPHDNRGDVARAKDVGYDGVNGLPGLIRRVQAPGWRN